MDGFDASGGFFLNRSNSCLLEELIRLLYVTQRQFCKTAFSIEAVAVDVTFALKTKFFFFPSVPNRFVFADLTEQLRVRNCMCFRRHQSSPVLKSVDALRLLNIHVTAFECRWLGKQEWVCANYWRAFLLNTQCVASQVTQASFHTFPIFEPLEISWNRMRTAMLVMTCFITSDRGSWRWFISSTVAST